MTILVKASGSSLGNFFYLRSFSLNKKQGWHEEHKRMIRFSCVRQNVSSRHFWTETMASDNNRPLNSKSEQIVYSVSSCFLKILERAAEATGVIRTTVAQSYPA